MIIALLTTHKEREEKMKKSIRQSGKVTRGKQLDLSIKFESRCEKRLKKRKSEKAGRKNNRRK